MKDDVDDVEACRRYLLQERLVWKTAASQMDSIIEWIPGRLWGAPWRSEVSCDARKSESHLHRLQKRPSLPVSTGLWSRSVSSGPGQRWAVESTSNHARNKVRRTTHKSDFRVNMRTFCCMYIIITWT